MNRRLLSPCYVRGFTLVETLIVVVVLGIAAVAFASLTGNLFVGQAANRDIVVGTQLMQECAEKIMATRRRQGYTSVTTSTCGTGTFGGMGTTVSLKNDSGATVTSCATTFCTVTVTLTQGGASQSSITLQLFNY